MSVAKDSKAQDLPDSRADAASAGLPSEDTLRRIRDILFGEKVAELEGRCQALYTQLASVKQSLSQKIVTAETTLQNELRALREQLATQNTEQQQQGAALQQTLERLEQRLDADTDSLRTDLSAQATESSERCAEIEAAHQESWHVLEEAQSELRCDQKNGLQQLENSLGERLEGMAGSQGAAHEELAAKLDSVRMRLEKAVQDLGAANDRSLEELRQSTAEATEALDRMLEQRTAELTQANEEAATRLDDAKADRSTLAGLLRDLAVRLDDDGTQQ
ncbi:MAG: hypothetical protein AAF581_14120 [Planctomycetota bacterium]